MVADDDEGDWYLGDLPSGSSPGRETSREVLYYIQGLVSGAGLSASDRLWNIVRLAYCSLCDHLGVKALRLVLNNERAEVLSRMAEIGRLKDRVCAAEKDLEAL